MKKIFNYTKFANDAHNTLVESFGALCDAVLDKKDNTNEYKEANIAFNESFMKECMSAIPNYEFSSIEDLKNPMIHNDIFMQHRFDTLLAQMITPVIPQVVSMGFENLYDVSQVGWGDNAKYFVESNEMFVGATCSCITL